MSERNLVDFVRRTPGVTIGEVIDAMGYLDAAEAWSAILDANRTRTISLGKLKEPGTWRLYIWGTLPPEYEVRM